MCEKTFAVECRDDAPSRPFCSVRCKMIDLQRWLDGTYRISEPLSSDEIEQHLPERDPE